MTGVFDKRNARRAEISQQRKQNRAQMEADRKAAEQSYRITHPGAGPLPRPVNWKGYAALAIVVALFVAGVLFIRSW